MIRHIVLVRFAKTVSDAEKQAIYTVLGNLRDHLDGILDYRYGSNVSPEGPMKQGFEDGFWFDFADAAARDAYLDDPGHKAAGAHLVESAEGGRSGIVVFDVEISP